MAVSQDGSRLFVYSASAPGDYTIQVQDLSIEPNFHLSGPGLEATGRELIAD